MPFFHIWRYNIFGFISWKWNTIQFISLLLLVNMHSLLAILLSSLLLIFFHCSIMVLISKIGFQIVLLGDVAGVQLYLQKLSSWDVEKIEGRKWPDRTLKVLNLLFLPTPKSPPNHFSNQNFLFFFSIMLAYNDLFYYFFL